MNSSLFLHLLISASALAASGLPDADKLPLQSLTESAGPSQFKDCTRLVTSIFGDTCASISALYGVSKDDFIAYNPSLDPDCSNLKLGASYCISTTPAFSNITAKPFTINPAPTTFIQELRFQAEPELNTADVAADLATGSIRISTKPPTIKTIRPSASAVRTPTPYQTGLIKNCRKFHLVMSGDTCSKIASAAKISLEKFYAWNPAVGKTCASLWLDNYVCVAV